MRVLVLFAVALLACGSAKVAQQGEHIAFTYTLGGGPSMSETLPIVPGSLPCGRQSRALHVEAMRERLRVAIDLIDMATRPGEYTAHSATNGRVNLAVVLPPLPGKSELLSYSTGDPGNLFTCFIRSEGPDPFAEFSATFSCESRILGETRLLIRTGTAHALICPPLI